jgi:hypothetical protein
MTEEAVFDQSVDQGKSPYHDLCCYTKAPDGSPSDPYAGIKENYQDCPNEHRGPRCGSDYLNSRLV